MYEFDGNYKTAQSRGQMRYEANIPTMGEREFPKDQAVRWMTACRDVDEAEEEMADGDQWLGLALKGLEGHPEHDAIFYAVERIRGSIDIAAAEIHSLKQLLVDLGVARMK